MCSSWNQRLIRLASTVQSASIDGRVWIIHDFGGYNLWDHSIWGRCTLVSLTLMSVKTIKRCCPEISKINLWVSFGSKRCGERHSIWKLCRTFDMLSVKANKHSSEREYFAPAQAQVQTHQTVKYKLENVSWRKTGKNSQTPSTWTIKPQPREVIPFTILDSSLKHHRRITATFHLDGTHCWVVDLADLGEIWKPLFIYLFVMNGSGFRLTFAAAAAATVANTIARLSLSSHGLVPFVK